MRVHSIRWVHCSYYVYVIHANVYCANNEGLTEFGANNAENRTGFLSHIGLYCCLCVTCIVASILLGNCCSYDWAKNISGPCWANGYLFAYCHVAGLLLPIVGQFLNDQITLVILQLWHLLQINIQLGVCFVWNGLIICFDSDAFETINPSLSCHPSFPQECIVGQCYDPLGRSS